MPGIEQIFVQIIKSIKAADVIVVFTALISLIVNIISIYKNKKFERIWNQKRLDADLKSKARIEWIQKVRNESAELITLYYKILNETDSIKMLDIVSEAKRRSELLVLYFGPEESVNQKSDYSILLNTENNNGKNDMLVLFITSLFDEFNNYYIDVKNNKLGNLREYRKNLHDEIYKYPVGFNPIVYYDEQAEEEIEIQEPILDEERMQEVYKYDYEIAAYMKHIEQLKKDLVSLRDYMRVYLKIEWKIAKDGK